MLFVHFVLSCLPSVGEMQIIKRKVHQHSRQTVRY